MPVWLLELIKTSPYAAVPIALAWLIIRHWCFLLAGTLAVLHPDENRRHDARELIKLLRTEDDQTEPPDGARIALPPRRRRRRRRR